MDEDERNKAKPNSLVSYKHRSGSEKRKRALQRSLKAAGDDPKQRKLFQDFKMYDGGDGDSGYVLLFKWRSFRKMTQKHTVTWIRQSLLIRLSMKPLSRFMLRKIGSLIISHDGVWKKKF